MNSLHKFFAQHPAAAEPEPLHPEILDIVRKYLLLAMDGAFVDPFPADPCAYDFQEGGYTVTVPGVGLTFTVDITDNQIVGIGQALF